VIRTVDEAFEAGVRAAQADPPLSVEQVNAIALLLAPWLRAGCGQIRACEHVPMSRGDVTPGCHAPMSRAPDLGTRPA
jgi:hypothetical protein